MRPLDMLQLLRSWPWESVSPEVKVVIDHDKLWKWSRTSFMHFRTLWRKGRISDGYHQAMPRQRDSDFMQVILQVGMTTKNSLKYSSGKRNFTKRWLTFYLIFIHLQSILCFGEKQSTANREEKRYIFTISRVLEKISNLCSGICTIVSADRVWQDTISGHS